MRIICRQSHLSSACKAYIENLGYCHLLPAKLKYYSKFKVSHDQFQTERRNVVDCWTGCDQCSNQVTIFKLNDDWDPGSDLPISLLNTFHVYQSYSSSEWTWLCSTIFYWFQPELFTAKRIKLIFSNLNMFYQIQPSNYFNQVRSQKLQSSGKNYLNGKSN